jgi:hypothetical protein
VFPEKLSAFFMQDDFSKCNTVVEGWSNTDPSSVADCMQNDVIPKLTLSIKDDPQFSSVFAKYKVSLSERKAIAQLKLKMNRLFGRQHLNWVNCYNDKTWDQIPRLIRMGGTLQSDFYKFLNDKCFPCIVKANRIAPTLGQQHSVDDFYNCKDNCITKFEALHEDYLERFIKFIADFKESSQSTYDDIAACILSANDAGLTTFENILLTKKFLA